MFDKEIAEWYEARRLEQEKDFEKNADKYYYNYLRSVKKMNKKERKQFEKNLKFDIIKYLCSNQVNLDNYKEVNKALKNFNNKYYTEIKFKVSCSKDLIINIEYEDDKND